MKLFLSLLILPALVAAESSRSKRQVLLYDGQTNVYDNRWPRATVNFYMDPWRFDPRSKETVIQAMRNIANHTCVTFSNEPAPISIWMHSISGGSCQAAIGMVVDWQPYVFNNKCYSAGDAVHELTHALGFMHAHQRYDRDLYLNMNMSQYKGTELEDQYKIFNDQMVLVPYDYGSIMQYWGTPDEFTSRDPEYQNTMGSSIVAFYDYLMINRYYNCFCDKRKAINCTNHGYQNPRNCSKCNCPWGYGGDDCSQRAEPGATVEATDAWKPLNVSLDAGYRMYNGNKTRQIDFVYHFLWITAPANKTIEVNIESFSDIVCTPGCKHGGFEVKTLPDPRLTSPRQCCRDGVKVYKSANNPTIVLFFNSEGLDQYQLSYRYVDK